MLTMGELETRYDTQYPQPGGAGPYTEVVPEVDLDGEPYAADEQPLDDGPDTLMTAPPEADENGYDGDEGTTSRILVLAPLDDAVELHLEAGAGDSADDGAVERSPEGDAVPDEAEADLPTQTGGSDKPPIDKPPAGPQETGPEGEKPLLPVVETDHKWKALHDGDVDVVTDPETPGAEVVKVYRSPHGTERPIHVTTPGGVGFDIASGDIVQVFARDGEGNLTPKARDIFQGTQLGDPTALPEGYGMSVEADPKYDQDVAALREALSEVGERRDPLPDFGRATTKSSVLGAMSYLAHGLVAPKTRVTDMVDSGNPNETLVYYPFYVGSTVHAVTPSGILLRGKSMDVVEVASPTPDGGLETVRRTTLGKLAQEKGYMAL